jgi:hypothetical protein
LGNKRVLGAQNQSRHNDEQRLQRKHYVGERRNRQPQKPSDYGQHSKIAYPYQSLSSHIGIIPQPSANINRFCGHSARRRQIIEGSAQKILKKLVEKGFIFARICGIMVFKVSGGITLGIVDKHNAE